MSEEERITIQIQQQPSQYSPPLSSPPPLSPLPSLPHLHLLCDEGLLQLGGSGGEPHQLTAQLGGGDRRVTAHHRLQDSVVEEHVLWLVV